MTAFWRAVTGIALVLAVGACSDSGTEPVDDHNGNGGGGTGRQILDDPSFAANIQEIFNRRGCTSGQCHGTAAEGELSLTSGNSHANLVNVEAVAENGTRVIPGNANASYLVIRLEGRQNVGERMPRGGSPLDATDMGNIKNWINQGAKNN